MKSTKFITIEEIIEIHDKIIEKYGGEHGILNKGILEFAVYWVNSNPRRSVLWKVAVLLRDIVSGHPFVDGNKRTGFEVADTILKAKGYRFTTTQSEILRFLIKLAKEGMEIEEIVKWLKDNTKRVSKMPRKRRKREKSKLRPEYEKAFEESMEEFDSLLRELAKL